MPSTTQTSKTRKTGKPQSTVALTIGGQTVALQGQGRWYEVLGQLADQLDQADQEAGR